MRVLCDENVPLTLAGRLRQIGIDAIDVRELGLSGSDDDRVLERAVAEDRVIVTNDVRRFGNLLATDPTRTPGIVVTRLGPITAGAFVERVAGFLQHCDPANLRGVLTILEPTQTRRRP